MSKSQRTRVVIIGSSFAGLTAAFELKKKVGDRHEIVGARSAREVHVHPVADLAAVRRPRGEGRDIRPRADLSPARGSASSTRRPQRSTPTRTRSRSPAARNSPTTTSSSAPVRGLRSRRSQASVRTTGTPHRSATSSTLVRARDEWDRFLQNPGPVVIGTAQGGSCFGASYEFMFNAHHQIKKAGLQDVAPVTFITAEPFLGHFGLGGVGNSEQMVDRFFDGSGSTAVPNTVIEEARAGEIELDDGTILPAAVLDDRPAVHRRRRCPHHARGWEPDGASSRSTSSSATPTTPTSPPLASRSRSRRRNRHRSRRGYRRPAR